MQGHTNDNARSENISIRFVGDMQIRGCQPDDTRPKSLPKQPQFCKFEMPTGKSKQNGPHDTVMPPAGGKGFGSSVNPIPTRGGRGADYSQLDLKS